MVSASRISRSRWLVGSSISSRLGAVRIISASASLVFLAAGKAPAGGVNHVAAEIEATEVVAQILLARARLQFDHVPQRRLGRAQLFELVLGEVAELEVAARLAHACQRLQLSGEQLHQRRFAGAVAAEQADAAVRAQREAELVEDRKGVRSS
jgi:hypothetical protein